MYSQFMLEKSSEWNSLLVVWSENQNKLEHRHFSHSLLSSNILFVGYLSKLFISNCCHPSWKVVLLYNNPNQNVQHRSMCVFSFSFSFTTTAFILFFDFKMKGKKFYQFYNFSPRCVFLYVCVFGWMRLKGIEMAKSKRKRERNSMHSLLMPGIVLTNCSNHNFRQTYFFLHILSVA